MKKILSVLLTILIAASFASCKKDEAAGKDEAKPETKKEVIEELEEAEDVKDEAEIKTETKEENPSQTKPEEKPADNKNNVKPEDKTESKPAEVEPEEKPESKPANKLPETPTPEEKTLGSTLYGVFKEKANSGKSSEAIAQDIISNPAVLFAGDAQEIPTGGYLTGFGNAEIKGYKKAVTFRPIIGTIPFVGYIFELDGTMSSSDFISQLKKNANLRWNVCTEAEEMVAGSVSDKVFFVMCPKSLED